MFTAEFLVAQGLINVQLLLMVTFICTVVGDNVGYAAGYYLYRPQPDQGLRLDT